MRGASGIAALWLAALATGPAAARDAADDWDLTQNPEARLAMATVDFGDNLIAVRCRGGTLDVLISGLPQGATRDQKVSVSIGAIISEDQTWLTTPGTAVFSANNPGRLARVMRAGGDLDIRIPAVPASEGQAATPARRYRFPLPASTASINAVLGACDEPLANETDALPRLPGNVAWLRRPQAEFPEKAASQGVRAGMAELLCGVEGDGRLKDCQVLRVSPANSDFEVSTLRAARDARLQIPAGVETGGRVVTFSVRFQLD